MGLWSKLHDFTKQMHHRNFNVSDSVGKKIKALKAKLKDARVEMQQSVPHLVRLGFLVLVGAALGRMVVLLLRACLVGFDPPRVGPSGRSRGSSGVDFCCLLRATRLGFLVVRA